MKKLLKSFLAIAFVIGSMTLPVNAAEDQTERRVMCHNCFSSNLVSTCARDLMYKGSGTHSVLFGEDCTYLGYESHGYMVCFNCKYVSESLGIHYCLEIHQSCGRGEYNVCALQYFP